MEERVNLSIRVEPCVAITPCIKGFLSRTVDSYIAQGADPLKRRLTVLGSNMEKPKENATKKNSKNNVFILQQHDGTSDDSLKG